MVTCSICQEDIADGEGHALEGCGHKFHTRCIVRWYAHADNKACPNCRAPPPVLVHRVTRQTLLGYWRERARRPSAPKRLQRLYRIVQEREAAAKRANRTLKHFRKSDAYKRVMRDHKRLQRAKFRAWVDAHRATTRLALHNYPDDDQLPPLPSAVSNIVYTGIV